MNGRWFGACVMLVCGILSFGSAARAQDPTRLFTHEAAVELPAAHGLVRLGVPAEVLVHTSRGMGDLRLHDASGQERPYLLESGVRNLSERVTYRIDPTDVSRTVDHRGLETVWREHLVFVPPPQAQDGRWTLWLQSARFTFVGRIAVDMIVDERAEEIASATFFRMRTPLRERRSVELPRIPAGARLALRVASAQGYLEPTVDLEVRMAPFEPPEMRLPLTIRSVASEAGRTVLVVDRPAGVMPDRLVVQTSTRYFTRAVRVLDGVAGPHRELSSATLFRVAEIEGAERVGMELARSRETSFRVVIENEDSPPLADLSVEAVLRQPTLVFDSDRTPVTLRFGGGRVRAPRYDLQRWAGTSFGDQLVASRLPLATLATVQPNPAFDDGPALAFAMRAGRPVDATRYSHRASLRVVGAVEGASRVRLPASVLSAAREDLGDLRVVDLDGQQWPYLFGEEREDALTVSVASPEREDGRSRYRIELPAARVALGSLEIATSAPFVDRGAAVFGLDAEGRRIRLWEGRLARAPGSMTPLQIELQGRRVEGLELVVIDGDDAPLELDQATVGVPSPTLLLVAPDGDYEVFAGAPDEERADYEVERARALVEAVDAVDVESGAARDNRARTEPSFWDDGRWHTLVVWAVIVIAILILGLLTLRAVRQAPSSSGTNSDDEPDGVTDGAPPPMTGDSGASTRPTSF